MNRKNNIVQRFPRPQKRKMHIRRLHDEVMGEKSYQITLNESGLNQLVAAMGYLKATVIRDSDPNDPDVKEFKAMEQILTEALCIYGEGDEACFSAVA